MLGHFLLAHASTDGDYDVGCATNVHAAAGGDTLTTPQEQLFAKKPAGRHYPDRVGAADGAHTFVSAPTCSFGHRALESD